MIPPEWSQIPAFAQLAAPTIYAKNVQTCASCGFHDVEVGTVFWNCAWCSWWRELGRWLVECYLGMSTGDGVGAAYAWQRAFDQASGAMSWPRYQRSGVVVRTNHPAILGVADARALRLCWQFIYGVWPERLESRNKNRYYDHGPGAAVRTPQTFRRHALAAARVILRRVFARRSEVVAKAPPKVEMRRFMPQVSVPTAEIVKVPGYAAIIYEEQLRACARARLLEFVTRTRPVI